MPRKLLLLFIFNPLLCLALSYAVLLSFILTDTLPNAFSWLYAALVAAILAIDYGFTKWLKLTTTQALLLYAESLLFFFIFYQFINLVPHL